jgi:hypothetical protein
VNFCQALPAVMHVFAEPATAFADDHSRIQRQTLAPGRSLRTQPVPLYAVPAVVDVTGRGQRTIE